MNNMQMRLFCHDRDKAFTAAVMDDDWEAIKKYSRKYLIPLPSKENVMKAGVYKAVQECTDIPQNVKDTAREKCIALGFKPTMWEG